MLERWHGLSKILSTPQASDASSARPNVAPSAWLKAVNVSEIMLVASRFLQDFQPLRLQEPVDFRFCEKAFMAHNFFAVLIQKYLGRNDPDAVGTAIFLLFRCPDIVKDDANLLAIFLFDGSHH